MNSNEFEEFLEGVQKVEFMGLVDLLLTLQHRCTIESLQSNPNAYDTQRKIDATKGVLIQMFKDLDQFVGAPYV